MNACINNLRQIDGATQQWALETKQAADADVTYANIQDYLKNDVRCPAAGTNSGFSGSYALTKVNAKPTCKIVKATHVLPDPQIQRPRLGSVL